MEESPHKRLVRDTLLGVFVHGRYDLIDEVYVPPIRPTVRGLATLLRTAFPDLAMKIDQLIQEDDKVACRWIASGTHTGPFHGIPASGAAVSWTGTSIYGLDGPRIVAVLSNWDTFGLMRQIREAIR